MEINKKLARILIVDDNIDEANRIYSLLRRLGYEVTCAFSHYEVESAIRVNPFNIVLLDCVMPEKNGPVIAQNIYSTFKSSISVILMSGIVNKSNMAFCRIPNVKGIIKKPFDDVEFSKLVKKIIKEQFYSKSNEDIYSLLSEKVLTVKQCDEKIKKININKKEHFLLLFSYFFHSKSEGILSFSKNNVFSKIHFYNGRIVYFDEDNFREKSIRYIKEKNLLSVREISDLSKIKSDIIIYTIKQSFLSPHHYIDFVIERVFNHIIYFSHQKDFKIEFQDLKQTSSDFKIDTNFDQSITLNDFSSQIGSYIKEHLSEHYLEDVFKELKDRQIDLISLKESHVKLPFLNNFLTQKSKMKDFCLIKEFCQLFKDAPQVYTNLYKALIYNFIKIKQNLDENQTIEKFHLKWCSYLLKELETLDVTQVFERIGCKDANDFEKMKSVYRRFLKVNHLDSDFCSSKEVKNKMSEVLKIINHSYRILSNKNKIAKYRQEQSQQESLKVVAFKELESEFQTLMLAQKQDELKKMVKKMEVIVKILPALEVKMNLYRMVYSMKENNYLIKEDMIAEFSSKLVNESHYDEMKELYFYVRGCLEICKGDLQSAQLFFKESMKKNEKFSLAKFEMMNLKNKSTKGFFKFKKSG